MSGQATGWVLRHGPKERSLRAVMLAVADRADRHGKGAHPGLAAIADGALLSRRQTITVLQRLVDNGWLIVEKTGGGRGRATVYSIAGMNVKSAVSLTINGAVSEPKECSPETETVQSDAGKGATQVSEPQSAVGETAAYGKRTTVPNDGSDNPNPFRPVANQPDDPDPKPITVMPPARVAAAALADELFGCPQKPLANFAKVRELLAEAIANGRSVEQLRAAVFGREVVWSRPGLATALAKASKPVEPERSPFLRMAAARRGVS